MPRRIFTGCCPPPSAGDSGGSGGTVVANPCVSVVDGSPATVTVAISSTDGSLGDVESESPVTFFRNLSGGGVYEVTIDSTYQLFITCSGTGKWHYARSIPGVAFDNNLDLIGGSDHSPVGATGTGTTGSGATFTITVSA
jgi:hypothetical protein